MMPFAVTTLGRNTLGLRELLERFAAEQWIPAHYTRPRRRLSSCSISSSGQLPWSLNCWKCERHRPCRLRGQPICSRFACVTLVGAVG